MFFTPSFYYIDSWDPASWKLGWSMDAHYIDSLKAHTFYPDSEQPNINHFNRTEYVYIAYKTIFCTSLAFTNNFKTLKILLISNAIPLFIVANKTSDLLYSRVASNCKNVSYFNIFVKINGKFSPVENQFLVFLWNLHKIFIPMASYFRVIFNKLFQKRTRIL